MGTLIVQTVMSSRCAPVLPAFPPVRCRRHTRCWAPAQLGRRGQCSIAFATGTRATRCRRVCHAGNERCFAKHPRDALQTPLSAFAVASFASCLRLDDSSSGFYSSATRCSAPSPSGSWRRCAGRSRTAAIRAWHPASREPTRQAPGSPAKLVHRPRAPPRVQPSRNAMPSEPVRRKPTWQKPSRCGPIPRWRRQAGAPSAEAASGTRR